MCGGPVGIARAPEARSRGPQHGEDARVREVEACLKTYLRDEEHDGAGVEGLPQANVAPDLEVLVKCFVIVGKVEGGAPRFGVYRAPAAGGPRS